MKRKTTRDARREPILWCQTCVDLTDCNATRPNHQAHAFCQVPTLYDRYSEQIQIGVNMRRRCDAQ